MQVNSAGAESPSGPQRKRSEATRPDADLHGRSHKAWEACLQPDRAEISGLARDLARTSRADAAATGELPPERMKQILERVASGFYEQRDVRETVVRRIAQELEI